MIALDITHASPSAVVSDEAPLRLAAASGMGRAFLVVHFQPAAAKPAEGPPALIGGDAERLADLEQAFVAELRELGGMTVIA